MYQVLITKKGVVDMARKSYTTVALPDELIEEVDDIIKQRKRGFTSRGEFTKEAVRKLLDELKK